MTERNTLNPRKVSVSGPTAAGSVAKAAWRAGGGGAGARRGAVSVEERERMIAVAAFYRAEQRGFAPGQELEDWCAAEAGIDRQLGHR